MRKRVSKQNPKRTRFIILLFLAVLLIGIACTGRFLAPFDPLEADFTVSLQKPGGLHICGTDKLGRDIFSRILCGAGTSFSLTFLMVTVTSLTGTVIGMTAGYLGGRTDTMIMRFTDILLAFPSSVFAIAVAGILGAGIFHTVMALSFVWWTKYARMSRGLVSAMRGKDFLCAARFSGVRGISMIRKYILPNIMPQMMIMATLDIGSMMMALAGLSFLGLAAQPPAPEWGYMLFESKQYMQTAPWMMIYPGLAILITVMIFNLLGDSVRDLLDPRRNN
ncbi:MAG: ABC transporter permease subunit [Lachnospiraceae bacterium]|nr:ABC transporter permease subunit [Lachnospiraceae bacterium]